MKKCGTTKAAVAGALFLAMAGVGGVSGDVAPVVGGGPQVVAKSGTVDIPFKGAISADGEKDIGSLFSMFQLEFGFVDLRKQLSDQLLAHQDEILKKDPQYFAASHVEELAGEANKALADAKKDVNKKIADEYQKQIKQLEQDLAKDSPELEVASQFRYAPGNRENGSPVWISPPSATIKSKAQLSTSGTVVLDETVTVSAAGVPLTLVMKMQGDISLTAKYKADLPVVIAQTGHPVTDVSTAPTIGSESKMKVPRDALSGGGGGGRWRGILEKVSGKLQAVPNSLAAEKKPGGQ